MANSEVRFESKWESRGYSPADQEAVLRFLPVAFGSGSKGPYGKNGEGLWDWKHFANPFGPSYIRLAVNEAAGVIGLRAFMQWCLQTNGRTLKAVRPVDTATHPDYRRAGIFSALTHQVVDEATQGRVDLIFNTPNRYSLPGYLKMGWHYVATVRPMVCVLNPSRVVFGLIRSLLGHLNVEPYPVEKFFHSPPPELGTLFDHSGLEPLLARFADLNGGGGKIATVRSVEYLRWRYAQHPNLTYYPLSVGSDTRLQGCAIFRTNTRFGLKEVVLCELFLAEPKERLCRNLLDQMRASLRADYLVAYFPEGSFLHDALGRYGFGPVPGLGMNFVVRPLATDLPQDPRLLDRWGLTVGDLEFF